MKVLKRNKNEFGSIPQHHVIPNRFSGEGPYDGLNL